MSMFQVLCIRFWMSTATMFKVWHGIHYLSMLLPLVQIEHAEFMSISLNWKEKELRRQIMFVNMWSQRQNSRMQMTLRLGNKRSTVIKSMIWFHLVWPLYVSYAVREILFIPWWDITFLLSKVVLVTWWVIFSCSSR